MDFSNEFLGVLGFVMMGLGFIGVLFFIVLLVGDVVAKNQIRHMTRQHELWGNNADLPARSHAPACRSEAAGRSAEAGDAGERREPQATKRGG